MHNAVYEKETLLKDTSYRDTIFKTKLLALCVKRFSFSNTWAKIKIEKHLQRKRRDINVHF